MFQIPLFKGEELRGGEVKGLFGAYADRFVTVE